MLMLMQQTYNLYLNSMYKHKPIAKNYDHRAQKPQRQSDDSSDGQEELFQKLLQNDCDCHECRPEEDPFLSHLLSSFQQEEPGEEEEEEQPSSLPEDSSSEEQPAFEYCEGSYALARINAEYIRRMGSGEGEAAGATIRFESSVRVKFFNDEQPVCVLGQARQYITSFHQYYQTSEDDEDRQYDLQYP